MDKYPKLGRERSFDLAKGLGIILVVWAHAYGPFTGYITSFHMPFFFFISGMLYKDDKTINDYITGKVKSLLLPFWVYNFLFYPVFFVLFYWRNWKYKIYIKEMSEIVLTVNKVPFLGATWFLPALFWVSILIHTLHRIFSRHKICDLWLLPISAIITLVGFHITFPYKISRTMICSCFYVMGFIYNKYLKKMVTNLISILSSMVMLPVSYFLSAAYPVNISNNKYDNKVTFMIGATFSILSFIHVSSMIAMTKNNKIADAICYLGRNSIHIVIWQFIAFRFPILLQIIFIGAPLSSLTAFPVYDSSGVWFFIYLLAGIIVSLYIGKIMDKYILKKIQR